MTEGEEKYYIMMYTINFIIQGGCSDGDFKW